MEFVKIIAAERATTTFLYARSKAITKIILLSIDHMNFTRARHIYTPYITHDAHATESQPHTAINKMCVYRRD